MPVIYASTPDEQLESLTVLMLTRKLNTADGVHVVSQLRRWHKLTVDLERLQTRKYYLTVTLALVCFVFGVFAMGSWSKIVLLILPAAIMMAIFGLIIATSILESRLRNTLAEMMEVM